ncbi:hypothetical protein N9P17_09010 [Tateyamaria sp.]|nr:hypothetical protein [Tateyamaria sp.]
MKSVSFPENAAARAMARGIFEPKITSSSSSSNTIFETDFIEDMLRLASTSTPTKSPGWLVRITAHQF